MRNHSGSYLERLKVFGSAFIPIGMVFKTVRRKGNLGLSGTIPPIRCAIPDSILTVILLPRVCANE